MHSAAQCRINTGRLSLRRGQRSILARQGIRYIDCIVQHLAPRKRRMMAPLHICTTAHPIPKTEGIPGRLGAETSGCAWAVTLAAWVSVRIHSLAARV